ncbi:hypothetical protein [Streptomyces sp. CBMA156]|uniref:hypothetical protein n=1 Tax=Streptomyces sp. CBMA156 TaxID=1930280 RepID=UPI001CB81C90|nr:hypothetical protein [Streptomyces sp. CBMA156]MBD0671682.1 hypothetical protein [Streptomyces sp. CBMA156]
MDLTEGPGTGRNGAGRSGAGPGGTRPGGAGRIEVEIGELVLDGFAHLDHDRLAAAFRRELTRLVEARGVPLAAGGDRTLDLLSGLPPLPPGTSPQRLGEALARAVHSGLSGGGRARERGRP